MWAFFLLNYGSLVGAIIAVLFIGLSLIVGLILWISIRLGEPYKSKRMQWMKQRILSQQEGHDESNNLSKNQSQHVGNNDATTTTGTTIKRRRDATRGDKKKSTKSSLSSSSAHDINSSAAGGGPAGPNHNPMESSSFFALPKPLQS